MNRQILTGAQVFDGTELLQNHVVVIGDGAIEAVLPADKAPRGPRVDLAGGVLAPGFLDLQVNGGAGLMVDAGTTLETLRTICDAHLGLGSAGILPTLITDTPEATARVIAAGHKAAAAGMPGFLGVHLEGPHLDPRRKGAHDPALIRAMTGEDLARLCDAAAGLPALMLTLAPESATPGQIATLHKAGVIVSLGHSDCSYETARAAIAAGARCVTHLFNAMSQLGSRAPGLVGAALQADVGVGLIADGIHVHPAALRIAAAARPEGLFLISDCMAFAGSDLTEITLNNRLITRRDGRLTLADGTLAGADLTLPQAVKVMINAGLPPDQVLRMVTATPARVIGADGRHGHLRPGRSADLVHLDTGWRLRAAWSAGKAVALFEQADTGLPHRPHSGTARFGALGKRGFKSSL